MKKTSILKVGRKFIYSAFLVLCASHANAQVSGTKTIGIDYPSLADAISDLNINGISGAVTINIPAGYNETAPTGGYLLGSAVLNAAASATNTLTFQKSGAGADPLLTAPVGTSTTVDGIFTIQGTDYVTINGIDLTESALNTTATTWMEWGYGLVKLQNVAPFDGCQNVTIKNCTVTLTRLNTPSVGIYSNNQIATSTTALTITTTNDAMNNCKFYSNTIQNCNTGISLRGFAAAASPYTLYDQNNDIGGVSAATANTIQNFAGATAGAGVNLRYQNNANVAYNTINNSAGSGIAGTNSVYGVYTQNGTNPSVNITNNTINLTQGATGNALYGVNISFSGTGTINVNNNTFTANGGTTETMYMIYLGSANTNVNTNGNDFYNINVATTGSLYFIYHNTASTTANITCNNNFTSGPAIPYVNKTGGGSGTIAGYYNNAGSSGGFAIMNNNNFSYITMAGTPTFYGLNETNGGSGQSKFMHNNVISNITSAGGTLYGLRIGFTNTSSFSNNTISFLNAGNGIVYGINLVSGTTDTIANNRIHDLTSTNGNLYGLNIGGGTTVSIYQDTIYTLANSTAGSGVAYGIWEGTATTLNVYQNKVYDISAAGTGSSVNGMYLNSGAVTAYNNLVGDLRTPNLNSAAGTQLVGMYLGGGSSYNVYYNTVYLNGISTGADFGSCAVFASTSPSVTLRNNIFVNNSTPNGVGLTVAYRRGSTTLTTYNAASNNNLFYAGTSGVSNVLFYDGTTTYPTLATFKALVAPRDGNSVTENPTFLSTTGTSASFLHVSTTVPTQIESGAVNIAGITTDIDGNIRSGNPGYAGTGTAPDMGAVEGTYILVDLSAPNITYSLLTNSCTTGDQVVTATITDASGVPTSGTLAPRIYFMKGTGTWLSAPGTLTSGTATNGTWSFTISAAAMGGMAIGNVVSYFIIAQDIAGTPNIGSNPSLGLTATDVNTISAYPATPNTYTVIPTLSGIYNVGVGMAYATITDAVTAYNTSCVSGPVTFQLTDPTYSTAETFPITINANASASAVNTLTIKPAPGPSPLITGSATAIFVLNGADYVTIDGSNSAVLNSICPRVNASRNMTIYNTSTSTSSAVVWIQTATGSDGATNNIVRNTNITGSSNTQTLFGIGSGGTSISYTSGGTGNNNNRIENDSISATQTGIYSRGASATNKNSGTVINLNLLNGTAPNNLRNNGIVTGFEDNITISGNYLANITNNISSDIIAIDLGFDNNATTNTITTGNDVTNATVTYNKLDNITQTNTWSCLGIAVAGVTSGTTTIANNMISGVLAKGTGGDFSSGIFIGGASGGVTNVFYNSINITGSMTGASTPGFAVSISGTNPIVNMKNNIFVNEGNPGSLGLIYAVGLGYSTYSNLSSNHNDFYSAGTNLGIVGGLSGGTSEPTLAAWRTATSNDATSANANPVFTSASDLHLTPVGANLPLNNTGIPVAITTDYDCAPRDVATPDLGINEFTIPPCASVTAGVITAATPSFCGSGSTTITVTGASSALGITYRWESSTDSISWTAITRDSTTYTIAPAITTTTYYRFIVTCSFSGVSDSVAASVTIHPLPVISVTPDGGGYCSGTSGSVSMTASGALSYTWTPATGLSATAGATVIANPTATTAYVVTGTDIFGCAGVHTSTITVTATPPPVTVTPSSMTFCSGNSTGLTASASLAANIFSDDFNSGLGLWTIDNTGSTNTTAIPNTQWDQHPDGYGYSSDIFHSPDASQFVMANSDPGGSGSTTHSMLISPTFSLAGYSTAALNFQLYYRYIGSSDQAKVEISTDGGATWTLLNDYTTGGSVVGSATSFATANFDLSPYLGNGNCKIRFNFQSNWGWYWAIDNVAITGSGTYTNITWSPSTGLYNDAGLTSPYTGAVTTTVYAAPVATTAPTINTYTATSTNGACTNTGTAVVTVNPLPNAGTITGPSIVCSGTSIALSDSAAGGSWGISNASATISGAGVATGVAAGTDTVSYTVTNICGTAVTTATITINPLPNAGTITGPANVCGGGAMITLADTVSGGVWSSSNASANVSGSGVVTGVYAGIDTISYAVTNFCGTAIASQIITVDTAANAGTISGATNVCAGTSTTLSDNIAGGVWSTSSAVATVSGGGVVTGISSGTALITYAVTNGCGTAHAFFPIVVNAAPTLYTVTGGGTYCSGGAGVPVGLSGSDPGTSYQLFLGISPLSAPFGTGTPLTYGLQATPGVYTIIATTSIGCVRTMAGSATVSINPTVPPTVSISASSGDTVCLGSTTTFNAIATNGGMTPTYQWFVNGINVSTGNTYSYSPTNGDVVSVTITSSSCASPDTASSAVAITVVPYATPSVSITASTGDTSCNGSPVTFTATPVFGGISPLLRWTVNGVNVATGPTFTYTPTTGDVIYCALLSSFPCILADSVFSNNITMTVQMPLLPSVVIIATPGTTIATGQSDTLTAVVTNGGTSPTYQWAINGTDVPGANSATFIYNGFMNHDSVSVTVTSGGTCGGLQTFNWVYMNVGTTGVSQVSGANSDIRLIPNPNKGAFTVKGTLATTQDATVTIEITDMLGQVIYKQDVLTKNGLLNEQIILNSTLANGMYMLNLHTGDEHQVFHFVIEQ